MASRESPIAPDWDARIRSSLSEDPEIVGQYDRLKSEEKAAVFAWHELVVAGYKNMNCMTLVVEEDGKEVPIVYIRLSTGEPAWTSRAGHLILSGRPTAEPLKK